MATQHISRRALRHALRPVAGEGRKPKQAKPSTGREMPKRYRMNQPKRLGRTDE